MARGGGSRSAQRGLLYYLATARSPMDPVSLLLDGRAERPASGAHRRGHAHPPCHRRGSGARILMATHGRSVVTSSSPTRCPSSPVPAEEGTRSPAHQGYARFRRALQGLRARRAVDCLCQRRGTRRRSSRHRALIRVDLAGEGKNGKLGGFAVGQSFRDDNPEPGVVEALLRVRRGVEGRGRHPPGRTSPKLRVGIDEARKLNLGARSACQKTWVRGLCVHARPRQGQIRPPRGRHRTGDRRAQGARTSRRLSLAVLPSRSWSRGWWPLPVAMAPKRCAGRKKARRAQRTRRTPPLWCVSSRKA